MGQTSSIEWTDATWTPIRARHRVTGKVGWHCEHVSPGCANCYSETFNERRLGTGLPFKPGHRDDVEHFLDEVMLLAPLRWRRPRRIFVCSMTDLFGDWVPDAWIDRVFAVMALCPQHTFQVLTKRSARMRAYVNDSFTRDRIDTEMDKLAPAHWCNREIEDFGGWPLPSIWLGVSAEDQRRADERVPDLLATPAAVRFVSAEPLLGPVDLTHVAAETSNRGWHRFDNVLRGFRFGYSRQGYGHPRLDWIIVGGERGQHARPMHPDWARSLRDQCAAAGVLFHFKQWGEFAPVHELRCNEPGIRGRLWHNFDPDTSVCRIGKVASGRLLDGVEHNGMPPHAR